MQDPSSGAQTRVVKLGQIFKPLRNFKIYYDFTVHFIISCLSLPPVRTYLSIYGGQRVGRGGGTGESNYGLRLPDWQQIIFMSTQEDRKRPHDFFSSWILLWKRAKPTQSSPAAGNSSIARIHKGQTGTKYSNAGNLADAHSISHLLKASLL